MKKKIVALALSSLAALSLVSCNGKSNLVNADMSKFVQLGDYTGLELEVPAPTVDESQIESEMMSRIVLNADKVAIKEGTCKNGDKVNINFEGYVDSVQFEGGTADNQVAVLGSGTFIPGFEEGIVGMEVGEVKDIPVTFPENYGAADLAGKPAIFRITLNFIYPELTDEVVAKMGKTEYSNVKELHDYIYNQYYTEAVSKAKDEAVGIAVYEIVENSVFKEIPQEFIDEQKATMHAQLDPLCESYGTTADEYVKVMYGTTISEMSEKYVKQRMVLMAIAKNEKLEVSDATVTSSLESAAERQGQTVDEYLEKQGITADYIKEYMVSQLVYDYLYENNNFIEVEE